MRTRQSGFTLIELVIVIVILGLLAATALPKFVDLTTDARTSAVKGVAGGFRSGVAIAHARWLADGASTVEPVTVTMQGTVISLNSSGWPDITDYTPVDDLYTALMNEPFSSLGSDWSATTSGGDAEYTLDGSGGGTFTYDDDTGQVAGP